MHSTVYILRLGGIMTTQVADPVIGKLQIMEKRYQSNLSFFKEKVPEIFKLLNEDKSQPEITITPKNQEIHRMENNKPVYLCNPIEHAIREVDNFDAVFENGIYPPNPIGIKLSHLIKDNAFANTVEHYKKIMETYGRDSLKPAVKDLLIFGIGMGYHIEMLCNKHNYRNITIIEHEIKNLKTSMYCINWMKILKKLAKGTSITIHLSKGKGYEEEYETTLKNHCFRLFPTIGISTIIYNHYPDADKYSRDKKIIEEFAIYIKSSNELIGPEAQRLFNANENIKNGFDAIDLDKSKLSTEKIIAIVGAGPSLDKYINTIVKNREKFYLVSAGSGLSSLVKLGIFPDLHFELEFQILASTLLKYIDKEYKLNKLNIICTYEASPEYPKLFNNAYMFIPESSELTTEFGNEHILKQGGITCTNGATALLSRITDDEIYLIGLDFAHTGGQHHSKTNISMNDKLPKNLELVHTCMKNASIVMEVKDTSGNNVLTSPGLNAARINMEYALKNQTGKYYNCSYGANINGAEFLSVNDLNLKVSNLNNKNLDEINIISSNIDSNLIHKRTRSLLINSLSFAKEVINTVETFNSNSLENCTKIISIFTDIYSIYRSDRGKLRNVLSISKAPLIQLFIVCNYPPEIEQKEMIKVWLNDYKNYIDFLEKLFNRMCDNQDFTIEKDWTY